MKKTKYFCPNCNALFDNINIQSDNVVCHNCNEVYSHESLIFDQYPLLIKNTSLAEDANLEEFQDNNNWIIKYKWKPYSYWFFNIVSGSIFATISLLFLNFTGFSQVSIVLLVFLILALYMIYSGFVLLVNSSVIKIDEQRLSVNHFLPLYGMKRVMEINKDALENIFIIKDFEGQLFGKERHSFTIMAKYKNGNDQIVIKNCNDLSIAEYIEYRIEQILSIEDLKYTQEYHHNDHKITTTALNLRNLNLESKSNDEFRNGSTNLKCENCNKNIVLSEINTSKLLKYCSTCNSISRVDKEDIRDLIFNLPYERNQGDKPKSINIEYHNSETIFSIYHRKVNSFNLYTLLFISLFVNIVSFNHIPIFPGILFQGVSLILLLSWIKYYFSSYHIKLEANFIIAQSNTVFKKAYENLNINKVKRVYVAKKVRKTDESNFTYFDLNALLHDGQKVKLIGGFNDLKELMYLENAINATYNFQYEQVDDEINHHDTQLPRNTEDFLKLLYNLWKNRK